MTDIAIIGMDCRFPKAPDPARLWDLLLRGGNGAGEIPPSRWDADAYYDPAGGPASSNTRHAGLIEDADAFDHEFFGFDDAEAMISDPQVRLLLQAAWRALEDATLDPRAQAGSRTGVYVGVMWSHWTSLLVADPRAFTAHAGAGSGYAMTANRISYFLDLTGPSMAIDTACSSSLVAAEQACAALRSGMCDQALVGGVNVFITPASNVSNTQAKVSAPDGLSKPFSAHADGFGSAEGVGVLVLRRLDDAIAEGLPVYAVIKGGAVNHGGRSSTVTAPNPAAHQAVIGEAYRRARVAPRDVTFVEAHGTGTPLGDRLEAHALGRVHGVPRDEPCAIGSIKGNLGHTEGAAGMASLIKTALALHHRLVPASLFAEDESPRLRLARNGLRLVKEPMRLPAGTVVGSISAFGWGGTNAHMVLASAPEPARRRAPSDAGDGGILTVSAPDAASLRRAVARLADDVAARPETPLAELAWTSNKVKASGRVRFALPVRDRERALADLAEATAGPAEATAGPAEADRTSPGPARAANRRPAETDEVTVGWVFPSEHEPVEGMSRALAGRSPAYRRALAGVEAASGGSDGPPEAFTVAYAVGRTLLDLGVRPAWMVAEGPLALAAGVLAGALDLADACRLAAAPEPHLTPPPWREPPIPILKSVPDGEASHLVELLPGREPVTALRPLTADGDGLLRVVAELYRAGLDPDWDELYEPESRVRHRLTPYQFAATGRFWWPPRGLPQDDDLPQEDR